MRPMYSPMTESAMSCRAAEDDDGRKEARVAHRDVRTEKLLRDAKQTEAEPTCRDESAGAPDEAQRARTEADHQVERVVDQLAEAVLGHARGSAPRDRPERWSNVPPSRLRAR